MTYLMLLEDIPLFLDKLSLPDCSSVSDIFTFLMRIMLVIKNNTPVASREHVHNYGVSN